MNAPAAPPSAQPAELADHMEELQKTEPDAKMARNLRKPQASWTLHKSVESPLRRRNLVVEGRQGPGRYACFSIDQSPHVARESGGRAQVRLDHTFGPDDRSDFSRERTTMSTPMTSDDLVQLIRKSGLLEEHKLATFHNAHQHDGLLHGDAKKVVATMVREGSSPFSRASNTCWANGAASRWANTNCWSASASAAWAGVPVRTHVHAQAACRESAAADQGRGPGLAGPILSRGSRRLRARPSQCRPHLRHRSGRPLHFLVMEYVDGTSLLEIVKKFGPLSVLRACHYIRQACAGLQYAYAGGMIHRDIKPGNIMVDRRGAAKLLTWAGPALSRRTRSAHAEVRRQKRARHADYVAPEQTRDSRNIDVRADIYGMGATFYFVLTGQPPFPEATVAEKLIAHQSKKRGRSAKFGPKYRAGGQGRRKDAGQGPEGPLPDAAGRGRRAGSVDAAADRAAFG